LKNHDIYGAVLENLIREKRVEDVTWLKINHDSLIYSNSIHDKY